ncbi:MAG: DEAD/DEAH box helicase [Candidatus Shapirobacteria bacterium]|nr:DEAD/DEAH box helicase [Candidatus Shapirobacteria bacterium]
MYNNSKRSSFGSQRRYGQSSGGHFGGPSFKSGQQRPSAGSRFGGGRPNGGGRGRGRANAFSKHIDPSLFIKKAEEFVKIEETNTIHNFSDFNFHSVLYDNITAKGYIKPTPIQDQTIEHILKGRDILGIANTGTGKTAAFALPLINQILDNPKKMILIMAPTRELATQIKQEIRSFTFGMKVFVALAIGGSFIREQIIDIKRGPHFIIGTPGRIKDLGERRVIDFSKIDTIVLDEVDRMLDMGFIEDIKSILGRVPAQRQTLFFSATVDRKVEGLIDTFLTNPVKISVKTQDSSSHVEQNVIRVDRHAKQDMLGKLLSQEELKKVLIFGATKRMVEEITITLIQKGFSADSIHGDKPQHKRQRVMKMFKESQLRILVATDVAARGLDIADITHVINYDIPNNYEDYIHRIGRTGRGNSKGFSLTFVS